MTTRKKYVVATIGYEGVTVPAFLDALQEGDVEIVADIRAVASSRRPGFAKTKMSANLASVGIGYVHMRDLGTPADGRAAARKGRHAEMQQIFAEHMKSDAARDAFAALIDLIEQGRRVCLLCFEADPEHCHRNLVAHALEDAIPCEILHLRPETDPD
jgi:uncharacterized protein (DUF488 family)